MMYSARKNPENESAILLLRGALSVSDVVTLASRRAVNFLELEPTYDYNQKKQPDVETLIGGPGNRAAGNSDTNFNLTGNGLTTAQDVNFGAGDLAKS